MAIEKRVIYPALTARIGELIEQADLIAKQRALGWLSPDLILILAYNEKYTNPALLEYVGNVFELARTPEQKQEAQALFQAGKTYDPSRPYLPLSQSQLPPGERKGFRYYDEDRAGVAINKVWEETYMGPFFVLEEDHIAAGRAYLRKLGIGEDDWFVTLHVRTDHFIQKIIKETDDPGDEGHNDYRNADINTYDLAVEYIVNQGGWVIRIGDSDMSPFWFNGYKGKVIDYATRCNQLPWMDIFLMAAPRFMLCTTSGPWLVAQAFGVPVCQTNIAPFSERPFSGRDLFIPKLFTRENEPIPFKEALSPPLRCHYNGYSFPKLGLSVRDNTSEEILDLVKEMGSAIPPTSLQATYNDICTDMVEDFGCLSRMGASFLSTWKHLLPHPQSREYQS